MKTSAPLRLFGRVALAIIILLGVLVGVARLSLPLLENRQADIETLASEVLNAQVEIDEIDTTWSGFHPVIIMRGVNVLEGNTLAAEQTGLRLEELDVSIDTLASIANLEIRPGAIRLHIEHLEVHREKSGKFTFDLGQFIVEDDATDAFELKHLLQQPDVRVIAKEVIFDDQMGKLPDICVSNADMVFHRELDDLVTQLQASICSMAEAVKMTARIPSAALERNQLSGQLYIELQKVSLSFWQRYLKQHVNLPDQGDVDLKVWASLSSNRVSSLQGEVQMHGLKYRTIRERPAFVLGQMSADFKWYRHDRGWNFELADWQLQRQGESRPVSGLAVDYLATEQQYAIKSHYVQLNDLLPIIFRQPVIQSMLTEEFSAIKPIGVLKDLNLRLSLSEDKQISDYALQVVLQDIAVNALGEWPAISGIDGNVVATSQGGLIQLDTVDGLLDLHTLFRDPLQFSKLSGTLNWSMLNSGMLIESDQIKAENSHITTSSRLSIHLPKDDSPFVDVQTNYENGDGAYTSFYLPAKIMDEEAVEWLDEGIVAGHVEYGTFVLHGRIDEFPYDNQEGRFEVRFKVRDGILNYFEDWPRLDEIEAEVVFKGRSMFIEAAQGKIFNSDVLETNVSIADLDADNPILRIKGAANTASTDLMRYLHETRLAGDYQEALSVLDLKGQHKLNLDLTVPLSAGDVSFHGDVNFQGNQLDIDEYDIQMQDIKGLLRFSEKAFTADNITGQFQGAEATARVTTGYPASGRETNIEIQTQADVENLMKSHHVEMKNDLSGTTDLAIHIDVPDAVNDPTRLSILSDLSGVAINLPHPFTKAINEKWPLTVKTALSGEAARSISIDVNDRYSALLGFNEKKKIDRALVFLNRNEQYVLPATAGFVVKGNVADIDIEEWVSWLDRQPSSKVQADVIPVNANLTMSNTRYGQRYIENLTVAISPNDMGWQAEVAGDAVGEITYLHNNNSPHIDIDLSSVKIKKFTDEQKAEREVSDDVASELRPADIPTIDLDIADITYRDRDIGQLSVETMREGNNILLKDGKLINDDAEINASGGWYLLPDNRHETRLNVDLESGDFGGLIHRLGFNDTVEQGSATMQFDATASSSPANLKLSDWKGELDMSLREGEILEVDPGGAGRVFGLLSFHTLPRRLSLDFSDLFSKGMSFDEISGHFSVSEGQAYTNNLTMEAPSSTVEISGRVGLKDEDYDQMVKVTPNVSSSLPVAGALAGGPGLAVVMLITHQLLEKPINKITELEYEITGPWSDPQIKVAELKTPEPEVPVTVQESDTLPGDSL